MPRRNKYVESFIPYFYMRSAFDLTAYVFIDTARYMFPSITIEEAAAAFMVHHNVDENLHPLKSVIMTYARMNTEYIDAKKQQT